MGGGGGGVARHAGRRTNLDCVTLSQGMEQINLTSALPGNETFQIAHTRGKTVMKEAVPLPDEPVDPTGLVIDLVWEINR